MKTLKYIIFGLCVYALGMVSCTDYLKETPNGLISNEMAFSQSSDLEGAVNILYRRMGRSMFGLSQYINSQMGSDLSTHRASNKAAIREWDLMDIGTNNDRSFLCWDDKYSVIKAANFIIEGVERTPDVSQADIDYALGQAYFWRGWAYFYLVRAFGPVPLVTKLGVDLTIPLSSVKDVYGLIVEDLIKAESLLIPNYTGTPRTMNGMNVVANEAAAKAVLACVYMTMAGWPLEMGAEYYDKAADKALEIIDNSGPGNKYYYEMFDEYWMIHSKQYNWTNKEAICAAYFSYEFGTGDNSEAARGTINDIPSCAGGWTDTAAEIGCWVSFPDGPRKTATYPEWLNCGRYTTEEEINELRITEPERFDADGNIINDWKYFRWWDERVPDENRCPYFGKAAFTNRGNNDEYDFRQSFSPQANQEWYEQIHQMVRLSEVYLFYAESVGRAGKTNQRAIDMLNMVRNRADGYGAVINRAGATPYPNAVGNPSQNVYPSSMSAADLAEAAYNEHCWEICGWYWGAVAPIANNEQRMKRSQAVFEKRKSNPFYTFTDPDTGEQISMQEKYCQISDRTWNDGRVFSPYPFQEVEINPDLKSDWSYRSTLIK